MMTPEELVNSPVGREIIDSITQYLIVAHSAVESTKLPIVDLVDNAEYLLSGLDEGDFVGIVFDAGVRISDQAYEETEPSNHEEELSFQNFIPGQVNLSSYRIDQTMQTSDLSLQLAEQILSHPACQWWDQLWSARTQVWGSNNRLEDVHSRAIGILPQGKPLAIFYTSSSVDGLASAWEVASISSETNHQHFDQDFRYYALDLAPQLPVYEIFSLKDWAELCEQAPAYTRTGIVYPDWKCVAQRWSAVHLTMWGLINCQGVPIETRVGTALLHGWDMESTVWFEFPLISSQIIEKNLEDTRYWPNHMMIGDPQNVARRGINLDHEIRFRSTLPDLHH